MTDPSKEPALSAPWHREPWPLRASKADRLLKVFAEVNHNWSLDLQR